MYIVLTNSIIRVILGVNICFVLSIIVISGRIREATEDMGMLKSISLKNYKCFRGKTDIEITPLTVLCGVNSSGKSSILKSLLMLKQSHENIDSTNYMTFNGNYIDNGSFYDIISLNSNKNCFVIENNFIIENDNNSNVNFTKDDTLYRDLYRLYHNRNITKFLISYKISIIPYEGFLNSNKIGRVRIIIEAYIGNKLLIDSRLELLKINKSQKYMISARNIPDVSGMLGTIFLPYCTCYFNGMTLNNIYKEKITDFQKGFIPSLITVYKLVSSQYLQINYLAPLRENPKRNYVISKDASSVGISGENAPLLLRKLYHKKWNGVIAPEIESFNEKVLLKKEFTEFNILLQSWMNYLELGNLKIDNSQKDIIKIMINNHNLADVGFGISQSLPILIEGLSMGKKQTLILEQPEIHLHPKMQMKIADFLLSLSMQDKQVILETHSDHIVNRLVRRAMESELFHKKIQIYFLDKDKDGFSYLQDIKIDKIDGAICENANFFYQFASETEKIIDVGYKNLEKKRETQDNV